MSQMTGTTCGHSMQGNSELRADRNVWDLYTSVWIAMRETDGRTDGRQQTLNDRRTTHQTVIDWLW